MITWEACKKDFCVDGSLRDIYVTPATIADWRSIYSFLGHFPSAEFSIDGTVCPFPETIEEIFALKEFARPMLRVRASSVLVAFHFFSSVEIECDIDPREISGQAELDALLAFIRQLGDAIRQKVIITPESCPKQPFITYDPVSQAFKNLESGC